MIEEIEVLMRHWGEQIGRGGVGAGGSISSTLAGFIEWQGAPPRGEPGTRDPVGGYSMDHRAREVQACVDALERQGEQGQHLARLARLRYLGGRSVAEQMAALEMAAGSDRTYRNHVHRLHELVLAELRRRHAGTMEAIKRLPSQLAKQRRLAARRAKQAAQGIAAHYRSSDVAPPSAPVRPRQPPSE
ncbi:hypothetical protein OSS47_00505 [Pseudomonas citronellolis]|uniref:hypothetical protein n=1 Tax=Pseudomonas citronellolis TaxID=53408 RepID=UPI00226D8EE7|nr:hypothetical protein [Pseudomonas citronellolis]WAB92495.1 hypothetical protein OSS47_00505 [Pseudomonas citronellolis]